MTPADDRSTLRDGPGADPNPPVAYRVRTERTSIRCWSPDDAPALRAALDENDAHLRPWIPWMGHEPRSLAETAARLRRTRSDFDRDEDYRYAIVDHSDSEILGETGLYTRVGPNAREIGYWVGRRHEGRGLAREAAAAMVKVAFEISRVDRIEIHCSPSNRGSARIPERLGFTHEATLRRRSVLSDGTPDDSMIWTLFAADYPGSPASSAPIRAYDILGVRIL